MTKVPPVTSQPHSPKAPRHGRSKESQEEVARSLERELRLLTEEREERARQLGLDIAPIVPKAAE